MRSSSRRTLFLSGDNDPEARNSMRNEVKLAGLVTMFSATLTAANAHAASCALSEDDGALEVRLTSERATFSVNRANAILVNGALCAGATVSSVSGIRVYGTAGAEGVTFDVRARPNIGAVAIDLGTGRDTLFLK